MQTPSSLMIAALLASAHSISVEPGSLRANGAVDPIAVDTPRPRLTWRLASHLRAENQSAYQIQAWGVPVPAPAGPPRPDMLLWDSGRVASDEPRATYDAAAAPAARDAVEWRVRVWGSAGAASGWSAAARFEVALLDAAADWAGAAWITDGRHAVAGAGAGAGAGANSLPALAREFKIGCAAVARARLYVAGLGLHAPELNGAAVGVGDGGDFFAPGYATVERTVPYSTYDVAGLLAPAGRNVLGVQLGRGVYDAEEPLLGRYAKFTVAPRELKLIARLEWTCEDGEKGAVYSDEAWVASVEGPYVEASWYGGEEYDARKELRDWSRVEGDRKNWTNAIKTTGPPGTLVAPRAPRMKVVETVEPVAVEQLGDSWVFDFGVNFAGVFAYKIPDSEALEGTRITFWPGEKVGEDGWVSQSTTGSPIFDAYTIAGSGNETYSPKFLYHGFRYLAVNTTWTPSLDDMTGYVIRAANEQVLSTSTSSDLFNSIHKIIDRSIQSNMHSVLTDCPHREKLGWLEQDHLVFEPLALGYDLQAYGDDLVRTITDAQAADVPGLIPAIAPEYGRPMGGGYRNDPNWGNAIVTVPLKLYRWYGDAGVLRAAHRHMVEYMGYLAERAGGAPYLDDGGLGDWLGLDPSTPKGAAATFGYWAAARAMAEVDAVLDDAGDAARWDRLARDVADGFHGRWFNESGGFPHYCANSQACNALALDMGAVPADKQAGVLAALVASVEAGGWHWTVGEISLPSLIEVLHRNGRDDVLFKIMNQRTAPGYGYMVERGATSLWEHWDADKTGGSLNHFMYGIGDYWLLRLSGLAQHTTSTAWRAIDYAPIVAGDLTSASTRYLTPRGVASAAWTLDGRRLTYDIAVPVGSTGTVYLDGTDLTEGGEEPVVGKEGVLGLQREARRTVVTVGSGSYSFRVTMP